MFHEQHSPPEGFTIGICASDSASQLPALLSFIRAENFGPDFVLERVIAVASGCPESVTSKLKELASSDQRFRTVVEPERNGKARAINKIIECSAGKYLVMLNADAFPEVGAIRQLLTMEASDVRIGCASAWPVFEDGDGLLQRALWLMWSAHSLMSLQLNHAGISNHACDELLVVRRSLIKKVPANLVNDGAYIGGLVHAQGYLVKFSTTARVKIQVPTRLSDLIRQRQRVIFGHVQVWRKLGHPPRTIESMLFMKPFFSVRTLVRLLSGRPRLIMALPVVVASELISTFMASIDAIRSPEKHAVWKRTAR